MDLELTGRVALVTAASKGLGRATATQLAAEGARVMISSRGAEQLAATAAEISAATGAQVEHCPADVSDAADLARLLRETEERLGGVDVLVNNAGGPRPGGFDALDDAAWQQAFELNLLSGIRLMRGVLPHMRAQGWGRIVTIASSSIKQPLDNLLLSNTYRVAILGLAKSLAIEFAPDGVLVNTIGPGRIATDRVAGLDATRAEKSGMSIEEVRAQAEKSIPLGRYGTAEEFGKVAAFLVSGANTYLTGQAFLVDGGMVKAL
ncbi:3-oxoacyl-[acyl-carrier protein] reductase [Modestobacter sp. DSM 44400]|uniref:SDR family oxidoreductase n=1 Tax=Modestobacter sp. DSM 44400 TaxID=1550230 RepID=UPI0008951B40|nr:SDR family oxidoreductase [Modestobacter sp. DSM 44400]SDX75089.1 3-oxoacyl-[acyl-carrier protein] reductase [Modestobacter sp. DSM 44400]